MVTDQQYQELLERVQTLEQAQADQLVPGVFSINHAGELEENLTGKLTAKGIIFQVGVLEEATEGKPAERVASEIIWNTEAGSTRASVTAYRYKGKAPSIAKGLIFSMTASSAGGEEASLITEIDEANNQAVVRLKAGGQTRTLLRNSAAGVSDFLQLARLPGSKLTVGAGEITWPGGANSSSITIVPFGIGEVPGTNFHIAVQAFWGARVWFCGVINLTAEHFGVQGYCPTELPAAGAKDSFQFMYIYN